MSRTKEYNTELSDNEIVEFQGDDSDFLYEEYLKSLKDLNKTINKEE